MTPGFFMALDFGSQGLFSWLELFLIVESSPNLSWLRDVLGSFVVYFACVYFNGFSKNLGSRASTFIDLNLEQQFNQDTCFLGHCLTYILAFYVNADFKLFLPFFKVQVGGNFG
ncbi:PREDICTED: uncharacterized protein LOC18604705 isoform X4 [Theobroma cacao]|uniref:Uncharacterized protein LOC18604705 isoform X4 n=1 Tax=Theobroma cacao TaxID=3641 RepID=A0AB32W8B6_THECC|nr:PREDICTED: uncharacterized protein LOC18604705 isoform X4 [Theobroma cacao]